MRRDKPVDEHVKHVLLARFVASAVVALVVVFLAAPAVTAQAQPAAGGGMPNLRAIVGRPLPWRGRAARASPLP